MDNDYPVFEITNLSYEELSAAVAAMKLEPFRAKQIWHWLYNRGAANFDQMTTLAKSVRALLREHFTITRPTVSKDLLSVDGTRKWLLQMSDGKEVETVHIPEEERGTLCVSSQIGCAMNCKFCHTGTQMFVRNLEASEILGQLLHARDALGDWQTEGEARKISNIVMMGMGEPLMNYDNVAKAVRIFMHGDGIAISKRKITLSTSGIVPMIKRCGEELNVNLAISLHAVTDELRSRIVPINRKYPLAQLLDACRNYPGVSNARRITFEYIMLKDVNDSTTDARELVRLLKGIPAKVNLIPFNPWPGAPFERSTDKSVKIFGDIVNAAGYPSPVRSPRGEDIMAACGQLKSASMREAPKAQASQ